MRCSMGSRCRPPACSGKTSAFKSESRSDARSTVESLCVLDIYAASEGFDQLNTVMHC
jgi:hypothetical protein